MLKILKDLNVYIKLYVKRIIFALILAVAGSLLTVTYPSILKLVTDTIIQGTLPDIEINMSLVFKFFFLGFIVLFLGGVITSIQNRILASVSQYLGRDLRERMNLKINKIPMSYFDTRPLGDVMSLLSNDIEALVTALTNGLSSIITVIVSLVGAVILMLHMNVLLTFIVVLLCSATWLLNDLLVRKSQPYFLKQQNLLGEVNAQAEEIFSGHLVVKAFNAEKSMLENFYKSNEELLKSSWLSQFISGIMPVFMTFSSLICHVVIILVGAFLPSNGVNSFTIGSLLAFIVYDQLFSSMLVTLSQCMATLQPGFAASERIIEFLKVSELQENKIKELKDFKDRLKFSHVKFGYNYDKTIISDFNADVKAGNKIAIVGPTGAGKSTIMNLLMRYYELNSGNIYIDGVSINEISRENLHNLIGIVPQDVWTFNASVKENIIYSNLEVSEEKFEKVLKDSGLDYFIKALPEGENTMIDEASSLSFGQRQLITIARAMLRDAPILILDEATSSIDTKTEKVIQSALDELMKGRTSFVVAHRLSTIKNADLIFVLNNGDISDIGTHKELMAKNGLYAELYNSQFPDIHK